ncbi:MAG: hypothetical protein ABIN20_05180 [candidate division WOR-3 bacterium]
MKKLIALLIALPLFAGGEAWLNLGYGSASQGYDKDGNAHDIGGSSSIMNIYLGGSYDFYKFPTLTLFGGGDLRLSQHKFSPDQGNSVSSGFALQNLVLFLGAKGPFFKGKLGFLMDLGPEMDTNKIPNTDEQNAIMINLTGTLPNPMFSLSAGIYYFLTLEGETKIFVPFPQPGFQTVKIDNGDYFAFFAKGGYKFAIGEAGLELIYRMRTAQKVEGNEIQDTDGNHFSLIPYVTINPPAMPFSFFIKGAVVDEYLPYGISLMGKNDFVTRLGFTLGGKIRF